MCAEKSDERSHNSVKETARRPKRRIAPFFMHRHIRTLRFLCKPGCDYSNGHTCAVNTVGHAPAYGGCHDENEGIRSEERNSVAELIGGCEQALFFSVVCRFNSPCIDHNILCRGGKRDDKCQSAEPAEPAGCATSAHREQSHPDENLREHDPPAPMSKSLEQRQIGAIDYWGPQKLQRIGDPHPGEKPNRGEGGVFIAQPVAERVADQEKGKT